MSKISYPIIDESTTEELIPKIIKFGENARMIKKHYPSVWSALSSQYGLSWTDMTVTDELFEKKLEIMFLQDEEMRNKK